jgi:hypothetical protein
MRSPLFFLALAATLSGCYDLGGYHTSTTSRAWTPDPPSGRPEAPAPDMPTSPPPSIGMTVANGVQSGDMGEIRAFAGSASLHSGYYDTYSSTMRIDSEGIDATGESWWVMSRLDITGDLAGPAFAPGTHRVFTSATYEPEDVSVTGCSGPSYGSYTFDGPADQVTIDVVEVGDGVRRMRFEARFAGGTTTGSVDYRIDSVAPMGI